MTTPRRRPARRSSYVDMRACSLSKWDGDDRRCRWCNKGLQGRQRAWCGKEHSKQFRINHWYTKARAACFRKHMIPCKCENVRKHCVCVGCGKCTGDLVRLNLIMECNHISPRNGDTSSISCLHHQENLEPLCWTCHQKVTQGQRIIRSQMTALRKSKTKK